MKPDPANQIKTDLDSLTSKMAACGTLNVIAGIKRKCLSKDGTPGWTHYVVLRL
jgi:hypothetical protein